MLSDDKFMIEYLSRMNYVYLLNMLRIVSSGVLSHVWSRKFLTLGCAP